MTATVWIVGIGVVVTIVGVAAIVRAHLFPNTKSKQRGTAPGQGDTLIRADLGSGVGGHSNVHRVTKDPQAYAKGMMPGKRR